jgi:hypothetical protein
MPSNAGVARTHLRYFLANWKIMSAVFVLVCASWTVVGSLIRSGNAALAEQYTITQPVAAATGGQTVGQQPQSICTWMGASMVGRQATLSVYPSASNGQVNGYYFDFGDGTTILSTGPATHLYRYDGAYATTAWLKMNDGGNQYWTQPCTLRVVLTGFPPAPAPQVVQPSAPQTVTTATPTTVQTPVQTTIAAPAASTTTTPVTIVVTPPKVRKSHIPCPNGYYQYQCDNMTDEQFAALAKPGTTVTATPTTATTSTPATTTVAAPTTTTTTTPVTTTEPLATTYVTPTQATTVPSTTQTTTPANPSTGTTNNISPSATANVTVNAATAPVAKPSSTTYTTKTTPTTTVSSPVTTLPETGPVEGLSGAVGFGTLVTAASMYVSSRRELRGLSLKHN